MFKSFRKNHGHFNCWKKMCVCFGFFLPCTGRDPLLPSGWKQDNVEFSLVDGLRCLQLWGLRVRVSIQKSSWRIVRTPFQRAGHAGMPGWHRWFKKRDGPRDVRPHFFWETGQFNDDLFFLGAGWASETSVGWIFHESLFEDFRTKQLQLHWPGYILSVFFLERR